MFPHNPPPPGEKAQIILDDIIYQVNRIPEDCVSRILTHLRAIDTLLQEMVDGKQTCRQEFDSGKSLFVVPKAEGASFLYSWNVQTGEMFFSPDVQQVLGIDPEKLSGDRSWWVKRIHPGERDTMVRALNQAVLGNAREYHFDYHVRHLDGSLVNLRDKAFIVRGSAGRAIMVNGYAVDIGHEAKTDNRKMLVRNAMAMSNIALRKSREQFRVALANAPVAMFQTDLELRYTWFYSPYFGLPEEKLIGKRDDEIFPKECVSEFLDLKWKALHKKETVRRELTLTFGDRQHTLIVSAEPFYELGDRVSGVIGSLLDVTEQRRLEARDMENVFKLEVNRRLLECREQERQLIARHIHDGPIQDLSSLGFTVQLARELSTNNDITRVLDQLGIGIKSLVGDLREVTNELRPTGLIRFGLTNAIRACAMDFEKRHADVPVKLSFSKAVNQVPEEVSLAFFRIFQESLVNIARHARASVVMAKLLIDQERVVMEIKDDGRGFQVPRAWTDFTREGCYGLALMKERIESVGGKLKIHSSPGEGTTIQVSVPRTRPVAIENVGGVKVLER